MLQVLPMLQVFFDARAFNQDIGNWQVHNVTWTFFMFANASAFNQDISRWDVSKVTKMYSMFRNATSFDQDIRAWDVSQVTDFSNMFTGATAMLTRYPTLNTTQGVINWFNSDPGS